MFKRLRELKISLAAKCQLLFGAAVVMIITAALWVPWQRMELLAKEINSRSARLLTDEAIAEHIRRPTAESAIPTTLPATAPSRLGVRARPEVRLVFVHGPGSEALTSFEKWAIRGFYSDPELEYRSQYHDRDKEIPYFRYARPLRADEGCFECHEGATTHAPTTALTGAMSLPAATQPTTSAMAVIAIASVDMPSQVETNQLLLNRLLLFVSGLGAGVLAIVCFYFITTRLILQPVRVLQETAEKVSEGDLNIRSDISTGDEFQQLSDTFNVMLENLKNSQDQLRAINKSLDLKLGQLAESNVALYESNRLKSEFLANVSHELRTPLNSILGFAELLKEMSPKEADARTVRYIQNILQSGRNLLELINDLLDLAKIEAGRMEVRSLPVSLSDLFEGLVSIIKPLVEKKDLEVIDSVAADVPILHSDPPKLQQVLYNFLSNALKFSPPGGKIELSAERDSETSVRISVTDHGPGIDPDKQSVIFEKFRQIDGSVTREHGGTGLGLAISRELVVLLGGKIGVSSSPGDGATFWIILPLEIQAHAQDVRGSMVLT